MSSRKTRITFHITAQQKAGLEALKSRDGIPEGEAVRRALDAFFKDKGIDLMQASREAVRRRARARLKKGLDLQSTPATSRDEVHQRTSISSTRRKGGRAQNSRS